jgi:hypothetical protein
MHGLALAVQTFADGMVRLRSCPARQGTLSALRFFWSRRRGTREARDGSQGAHRSQANPCTNACSSGRAAYGRTGEAGRRGDGHGSIGELRARCQRQTSSLVTPMRCSTAISNPSSTKRQPLWARCSSGRQAPPAADRDKKFRRAPHPDRERKAARARRAR